MIRIVRIGHPDDELLALVQQPLARELGMPVSIGASALDPLFARHPERNQHHSTMLLERVIASSPPIALAITDVDLYIPILTFVFGEAEMNGRACVVSYHRLGDEFYGLPPNRALLRERLIKEAVHELGHVLGLVHCHDYRCVMAASHAVEKIDLKGASFCDSCRAIVEHHYSPR